MSDFTLVKPEQYVDYPNPDYLYRNVLWYFNDQTKRGEKWLSNQYNFLEEMMKFVPIAEGLEDHKGALTKIDRDTHEEVYDDKVAEYFEKMYPGFTVADLKFYDHEFDTNDLVSNGFYKGSTFGDFKSVSNERIEAKTYAEICPDFSLFEGVTNFYHTHEEKSNYKTQEDQLLTDGRFLLTKTQATSGDPYKEYDEESKLKSLQDDVFPVWTASNNDNNRLPKTFYYGQAGYIESDLVNYYPTDYDNLFFGLNPSMCKDQNGDGNIDPSSELADLTAYTQNQFTEAKNYLNGLTISTDHNRTVSNPNFYEIAMDTSAPWNGGSNSAWADKGKSAFYLAILMLESRRRYFATMTNLYGPHRQFDGGNNWGGNIDEAMTDWNNRWEPPANNAVVARGGDSPDWMGAESGEFNKLWLEGFLTGQYRFTQWISAFGAGDAYFTGASTSLDETRINAFRNWMIEGLSDYRSEEIEPMTNLQQSLFTAVEAAFADNALQSKDTSTAAQTSFDTHFSNGDFTPYTCTKDTISHTVTNTLYLKDQLYLDQATQTMPDMLLDMGQPKTIPFQVYYDKLDEPGNNKKFYLQLNRDQSNQTESVNGVNTYKGRVVDGTYYFADHLNTYAMDGSWKRSTVASEDGSEEKAPSNLANTGWFDGTFGGADVDYPCLYDTGAQGAITGVSSIYSLGHIIEENSLKTGAANPNIYEFDGINASVNGVYDETTETNNSWVKGSGAITLDPNKYGSNSIITDATWWEKYTPANNRFDVNNDSDLAAWNRFCNENIVTITNSSGGPVIAPASYNDDINPTNGHQDWYGAVNYDSALGTWTDASNNPASPEGHNEDVYDVSHNVVGHTWHYTGYTGPTVTTGGYYTYDLTAQDEVPVNGTSFTPYTLHGGSALYGPVEYTVRTTLQENSDYTVTPMTIPGFSAEEWSKLQIIINDSANSVFSKLGGRISCDMTYDEYLHPARETVGLPDDYYDERNNLKYGVSAIHNYITKSDKGTANTTDGDIYIRTNIDGTIKYDYDYTKTLEEYGFVDVTNCKARYDLKKDKLTGYVNVGSWEGYETLINYDVTLLNYWRLLNSTWKNQIVKVDFNGDGTIEPNEENITQDDNYYYELSQEKHRCPCSCTTNAGATGPAVSYSTMVEFWNKDKGDDYITGFTLKDNPFNIALVGTYFNANSDKGGYYNTDNGPRKALLDQIQKGEDEEDRPGNLKSYWYDELKDKPVLPDNADNDYNLRFANVRITGINENGNPTTTTFESGDPVNSMVEQLLRLENGSAYDEFEFELFYNNSNTNGLYKNDPLIDKDGALGNQNIPMVAPTIESAYYELQPRAGDSNGRTPSGNLIETTGEYNTAMSWDRTWGNYGSDVGVVDVDASGNIHVFPEDDQDYSKLHYGLSQGDLNIISGEDYEFWSIITNQLRQVYAYNKDQDVYMNFRVNDDGTGMTGNLYFKGHPYVGPNYYSWQSKIGLRIYQAFCDSYGVTIFAYLMINKMRQAEHKKREDRFNLKKDENREEEIDNAKAEAKRTAIKKAEIAAADNKKTAQKKKRK